VEHESGGRDSDLGRSRRYKRASIDDDDSPSEPGVDSNLYGGLVLEVLNDFGVLIEVDEIRFQEGEWTYQGEPPLLCELCDEQLHVYRRPFRAYGKNLRWWGIVCPSCPDIFGLNILKSANRRILHEWENPRAPTLAEPQVIELEREHHGTGAELGGIDDSRPQENADELVVVTFNDPVRGSDPVDMVEFNSDRHQVRASRLIQDRENSQFVNGNGQIVAQWPTSMISRVTWPTRLCLDETNNGRQSAYEDRLAAIRQKYPNAYAPWTEGEEGELRRAIADGLSVREIVQQLQRQPGAITSRSAKLGLSLDVNET